MYIHTNIYTYMHTVACRQLFIGVWLVTLKLNYMNIYRQVWGWQTRYLCTGLYHFPFHMISALIMRSSVAIVSSYTSYCVNAIMWDYTNTPVVPNGFTTSALYPLLYFFTSTFSFQAPACLQLYLLLLTYSCYDWLPASVLPCWANKVYRHGHIFMLPSW